MKEALNIALVVDAIERGGVETFLFSLEGYFRAAGHRVTIVACAGRGVWWETARSLGINCVCLPVARSLNGADHCRKVGKYLAGQSYDCILLNHSKYGQAALGMLPESVMAIPVIHNDNSAVYNLALSNSSAWNIAAGVSPKVTQTARRLRPDKVIETILNGVQSPTDEAYKGRVMLEGKIKMLFVGRIVHEQKGVFYLPEIVKGCMDRGIDTSLTIVGDGESLDGLQSRIRNAGISDRIEIKGALPKDLVYQEMLKHHILLLPSHYEGFGLVPMEAQACGCVPIASRLPGITDRAIEDGRTGMLVNVGDIDAFVACVDKLYKDPLLWHEMSGNGHSRVEEQSSVEIMGKAYLDIIHAALLGAYPLQTERRQSPQIDKSILAWRCYVPGIVISAAGSLLPRVKLLRTLRDGISRLRHQGING